jgi:hypothetical protein
VEEVFVMAEDAVAVFIVVQEFAMVAIDGVVADGGVVLVWAYGRMFQ